MNQSDWTEWNCFTRQDWYHIYMPRNQNLRPERGEYWLHIYKKKTSDKNWVLRYGSANELPTKEETIGKYPTLEAAKVAYKIYTLTQLK